MSCFTVESSSQGNFGTGQLPENLHDDLDQMKRLFLDVIHHDKKDRLTHHIWYDHFPTSIREIVDRIRQDVFWECVCNTKETQQSCKFIPVTSMDELYYSNTPKNISKTKILYGASGNFNYHVDGMFAFPKIRFYRVLIGLTENDTVRTEFPVIDKGKFINTNDYVIFDFDKTNHQVVNLGGGAKKRILLKLHFCVCADCPDNSMYLKTCIQIYEWYEIITRYIMNKGTDPSTYYEFALGLLVHFNVNYAFLSCFSYLVIGIWIFLILCNTRYATILGYVVRDLIIFFLCIVAFFWLRYQLFRIR